MRHRGGGLKRRMRIIDFSKYYYKLCSLVLEPEVHDPFRTSLVSLVMYENGVFSLILKPRFLVSGDILTFTSTFYNQIGITCPLRSIPEGVYLNSVQFNIRAISKVARSAGCALFIINKFIILDNKILVKLPSSEEYLLNCNNMGTYGRLDNIYHFEKQYKKAGDLRRKGIRPHVRGVAMNPIDHPHGGNTSKGCHPVSLWGNLAKGGKTRKTIMDPEIIYKRKNNRKKNRKKNG